MYKDVRKNNISFRQKEYAIIHKWFRKQGEKYILRKKNTPLDILRDYENYISEIEISKPFSSEERTQLINQHIEFVDYVFPQYLKVLALTKLSRSEVGLRFGFKSSQSWNSSYNKESYIRGIVSVFERLGDFIYSLPGYGIQSRSTD